MFRSKKYKKVITKVEKNKVYTVEQAIKLMKEVSYTKFPGSVNMIINFSIPSKFKNESIRGSVVMPHQTGEAKTVVVIAEAKDHKIATDAGADKVGADELIKEIEDGYTSFDVLIATPAVMPKLAKLGKVLGPKGLMPNPRNETVTTNIEKVVKSYKSGKIDYKVDEQASVKAKVGKLSQSEGDLKDNLIEFIKIAYNDTKKFGPNRIKSIIISPTMGPGVKVDMNDVLKVLG